MEEVAAATIEAAVAVKEAAMVRTAAVVEMAEADITDRKGSNSGRDGGSRHY
jgi:hypothetical protein